MECSSLQASTLLLIICPAARRALTLSPVTLPAANEALVACWCSPAGGGGWAAIPCNVVPGRCICTLLLMADWTSTPG